MNLLNFISYIAIALTYLSLGLSYFPGLRMNRATIALIGSAALIALGVLNLEADYFGVVNKFCFGSTACRSSIGSGGIIINHAAT